MIGAGAQRVMLNLIQGLSRRELLVDLVVARAKGQYLAQVPESVRVIDLNANRVLVSLFSLISYLRCERPLAMLSALHYVNIIALWARRIAGVNTRLVVSEHNTLSRSLQHTRDGRGRFLPCLIKRFYPWANRIIAVSEGVADDLTQLTQIPRDCIKVIYNPVITPDVQKKAKDVIEEPWFDPNLPPVIIAVGRLDVQKDFQNLIKAFAQVRQMRPVRLMILGEGPERSTLDNLIRELGVEQDVILRGFVENPYAYMTYASLFVLSSKFEGLPTVLIEALYCGAPVIATDCPSGPREILDSGRYGRLVPINNSFALAQAILEGLDGRIPLASPKCWQPFLMDTVVDQYIEVLCNGQYGGGGDLIGL